MLKMLIIPFTLEGHVNVSLGLSEIISKSYNISYAVPTKYHEYVQAQGYECHILDGVPFGYGFEYTVRVEHERSKDPYLDTLIDKVAGRLFYDRTKKLLALMDLVRPDIILLDCFTSTDFIILYNYAKENKVKIAFFQTCLSTHKRPFSPPINSHLITENAVHIEREWGAFYFRQNLNFIWEKIKFLGKNNATMIKAKLKQLKIPEQYQPIQFNSINICFPNLPEFILAPQELEFNKAQPLPTQYYCGSFIPKNRKQIDVDEHYAELIQNLEKIKTQKPNCKIIYCAFGSMYEDYINVIKPFLQKLFEIIKSSPTFYLVCAIKGEKIEDLKQDVSDNIFLLKKIPQLEFLPLCDAFITHGGFGSIKESVWFGKPMLVYTIAPGMDWIGNAAKVVYHKIGIRGDINKDSISTIHTYLTELLENPIYAENVQKMSTTIRTGYKETDFLVKFEQIIDSIKLVSR